MSEQEQAEPPAGGLRELLERWEQWTSGYSSSYDQGYGEGLERCATDLRRALREHPALRAVRRALTWYSTLREYDRGDDGELALTALNTLSQLMDGEKEQQ